jgi:hypothetical protein
MSEKPLNKPELNKSDMNLIKRLEVAMDLAQALAGRFTNKHPDESRHLNVIADQIRDAISDICFKAGQIIGYEKTIKDFQEVLNT